MPVVDSYQRAREIVGEASGRGVEATRPEGHEDEAYYWVPLIRQSRSGTCWAVDKKTGQAQRRGMLSYLKNQ
ncbi:hypothetical protein [Bifidobacterium catulorum]|uniref:hypothetical protein n=1 Tax=Bifidobacterium catulorum TaxID=1630173 RepID=UPI0011B20A6A|nr:hypothetical protein [Bifidobacterium catulorum]